MRLGVALVRADHTWDRLDEDQRRALMDACDIISVRVPRHRDPVAGQPSEWDDLADWCHTEGVELRVHAWVGTYDLNKLSDLTPQAAEIEGRRLMRWVDYLGAEFAEPNGEAGLIRQNAMWRECLRDYAWGYADEAAQLSPDTPMGWVGYSNPAYHYGRPYRWEDADKLLFTAPVISVMAYGRTVATVRDAVQRAHEQFPDRKLCIWYSPGRIDSVGRVGDPSGVLEMLRTEFAGIVTEALAYIGEDQSHDVTSPSNPIRALLYGCAGPSVLETMAAHHALTDDINGRTA